MPVAPDELDTALTVEELVPKLRMTVRGIRYLISSGQMESIKIGKRHLVTQRMLADYLDRNRRKRKPA